MCLLASGGNSQIILVESAEKMRILGQTIDDAAGEAFDKCAKAMGLPYPGGPHIDRLAQQGDPDAFHFGKPHIPDLDYSFSGLKTSFLYTLRDGQRKDPEFVVKRKADLAASLQKTIVDILFDKLEKAFHQNPVRHLSIGGGVSANSGMRAATEAFCRRHDICPWIPQLQFTTDNAAMVAVAGMMRFREGYRGAMNLPPFARVSV